MAKNIGKEPKFPGLMRDLEPGSVSTHTQDDTHVYTHTQKRERKNRRVQLVLKESSVDELDVYAKKHDTSRNAIIQDLVDEFLKRNV